MPQVVATPPRDKLRRLNRALIETIDVTENYYCLIIIMILKHCTNIKKKKK